MGREMLEQELKQRGGRLNRSIKDGSLKKLVRARGYRDLEAMLLDLARGHVAPTVLGRELLPGTDRPDPEPPQNPISRIIQKIRRGNESPVLIGGEDDVLVSFAKCCNPLPGETVAGYITRGHGITVHRRKCVNLLNMEPERRIPVEWSPDKGQAGRSSNIRVICTNRPGLLANITKICSDAGINITSAEARGMGADKAVCALEVGVESITQLNKLMRRIAKVNGVISVDRVSG